MLFVISFTVLPAADLKPGTFGTSLSEDKIVALPAKVVALHQRVRDGVALL